MLIIAFASLSILWSNSFSQSLYLTADNQTNYLNLSYKVIAGDWFIQFLTYWVAYSHMIPISLYVIIELLKLGQAYLINKDVRIYDREDKKFSLCRNSDLIEELGQVEFVFSDKTGTLTQNKMEFKKVSING